MNSPVPETVIPVAGDVGLTAELPETEFYDEGEIALALGRTRATVNRRARQGRKSLKGEVLEAPWRVHHLSKVQGGLEKVYRLEDLPDDVQVALAEYEAGGGPALPVLARPFLPASFDPLICFAAGLAIGVLVVVIVSVWANG